MTITEITTDKKRYLVLLLLADEEERMIDCYLERGRLFVLEDPDLKTVCVVTDEGNGVVEIKKSGDGAGCAATGIWARDGGLCEKSLSRRISDAARGHGRESADAAVL